MARQTAPGATTCPAWSAITPSRVFDYLSSFGLTLKEILEHKIQWDEAKKLLIFPVYGVTGELVFYQGRYFGENKDHPKYITSGTVVGTYDIHWCPTPLLPDCVCIVEDFLSAVKVSRVVTSMPMFGSHLNHSQLNRLASLFSKLVWWVDPDKQKDYPRMINKSSLFFDSVHCIYSDKDPKYYSTEEVRCNLLV